MGKALKQMAEVRDSMDVRVKRSFIDPLQMLQEKELKEIAVSLVRVLWIIEKNRISGMF